MVAAPSGGGRGIGVAVEAKSRRTQTAAANGRPTAMTIHDDAVDRDRSDTCVAVRWIRRSIYQPIIHDQTQF